ncbi:12012_t:CDS:2, partial [Cetraspora pellucida]
MNNEFKNRDKLRKQKAKENETPDQRDMHLAREHDQKRKKRAIESAEKREQRLARDRERKQQKVAMQKYKEGNELEESNNSRITTPQGPEQVENEAVVYINPHEVANISEIEQNLLNRFCSKMDEINFTLCPVCNESFPGIVLVIGSCRRCSAEKTMPKKFSAENNMDPKEVPEELQGLTEVEEMLISQVFTDIQEFTTHLPRNPLSLNMLIVQCKSENHSGSFRDFYVRHSKVTCTLYWLKGNNRYYFNIIIDNEILQSLPEDDYIDSQLPQIQSDHNLNGTNDDDIITRTFVPFLPSTDSKNTAINGTLNRLQSGYIARAFPTLYPTGHADLRAERIKDVKPAEALQEGSIYVRQKLNDEQLTVADIQDMISEGSRGLVFFTFSAADLHWPELHKLIRSSGYYEERETSRQHCQNIINNPHIISWFFNKQFEIFFENVLKRQWELEDWWYRFEWQHRGSVHVHEIGKRQNAPEINWTQMKENENLISEVVQYLNNLVTTINPGLNAPVPTCHPCRKNHNEINDDIQDYIDLVNKVQRHTQCSSSYCLRTNQAGQMFCRNGYPKENSEYTFLRDDHHGKPELITARNDPIHAALQYIAKYASKAEPRSTAFSEILNQILRDSRSDDPILAPVQKLLLHSVAECDISAQETCHLLLGIPLYHSSRSFVTLNLNKEAPRWLHGTGSREGNESIIVSNARWTAKSPVKIYQERPVEFENFSLFHFNLIHKFTNNHWKRCERQNVIRIWPRPPPLRNGPQWEEFCYIKVLLHVCYRDLHQLTENDSITWTALYKPEMGPDATINDSSAIGSHSIDKNYDWVSESRHKYSNIDIMDASNFVRQASGSSRTANRDDLDSEIIDYETLNENQKSVINRAELHYCNILTGNQIEPLRIVVMGTADTGKSYFIKAIRNRLNMMAGAAVKSPVIVIASTGVAAFNINGLTIHSALFVPVCTKNVDIDGERLRQLQEKLQNVNYFIIDEKSMVGHRMIALIDIWLRQAFPECKNESFGGCSIIMFGDFGQLSPVLDLPMYATSISQDLLSNDSLMAYTQFKEVYKLDVIECQSGNSEEQQKFRDILLRLRDGESTLADWETLTTRFEEKITEIERNQFSEATFILPKWSEVDIVNLDQLTSLKHPVAKILAVHSGRRDAKRADSDEAMGLEAQLLLTKGARIMLTANLWTETELVNRAIGTVQGILYNEEGLPSLPIAVLISFDNYRRPTITTLEGTEVVPIAPIRLHKSQGLTLTKAIIDLGSKEFSAGLSFVAVSR